MFKKLSVLTLLISVFSLPLTTLAASLDYGYFGTTSETSYLTPDGTNHDDYWLDVTVDGAGSGRVLWYGEGSDNLIGSNAVPGSVTAPDGAIFMKLVSDDGGEIYAVIAHSTNPAAETVNFTAGDTSSGGGDAGGSNGGSDNISCTITNSCAVFDCPEWDTYMSKINQIASNMPEMPNWNVVAGQFADEIAPRVKNDMKNLFEDTVAPRIKSDMKNLFENTMAPRLKSDMTDVLTDTLGSAPDLPSEPEMPTLMEDIDLSPPTGEEAEGLGDSTFSENDIKNESIEIEERNDPTGGFNIDNPLETIEDPPINVPNELENNAPTPTEQENQAPTPTEDGAEAPTSSEQEYNAPTLTEQENSAPVPTEQENQAPTPSEDSWEVPIPSDDNSSFPIPSIGDSSFPVPSS